MKTKTVTCELTIPVGYRVAAGVQPRAIKANSPGTLILKIDGNVTKWNDNFPSIYSHLILEPDPTYIDTTTEEYRVEVYRQTAVGVGQRIRQVWKPSVKWKRVKSDLTWNWVHDVYRVKPEDRDESGPFYTDEGKKVYVPE